MQKLKASLIILLTTMLLSCGNGGSSSNATASKAKPSKGTGWYFGLQPPHGDAFWIGPYASDSECADMYGSCIYSHPFTCHNTGLPQDCGITGNGFCYPGNYPYPVPQNEIIAGDLNCEQQQNAGNPYYLSPGWYFVFYTLTDGKVIGAKKNSECSNLYQQYKTIAEMTPGDDIGYYSDGNCPGAPCFSVGTDTACE